MVIHEHFYWGLVIGFLLGVIFGYVMWEIGMNWEEAERRKRRGKR